MHLANYLGYLHRAELNLAEGFRKVADGHAVEGDIYHTCNTLAKQCETHAEKLSPFVERYGEEKPKEPERLYHELFDEIRSGGLGLLRDMQDLYLMADEERYGLHQRLAERFGERAGEALYTFVAAALAIAVSGLAAFFTGQPLIFPS